MRFMPLRLRDIFLRDRYRVTVCRTCGVLILGMTEQHEQFHQERGE